MPYSKLQFQSYVAPYVGNANKEFAETGKALNARFDANIAKYDALDSFANQLMLREGDSVIKDNLIKDIRDVSAKIREEGNWEDAKIPVREVAKRVANDQFIAIAQQNFQKEQAQKEYDNKLRATGATIDFNQSRFNQSTIDPETGKARILDFSGEEKLRDYHAKMNQMFEGVQADGYSRESSSPTIDTARGMIYQIGSGSSARYINKDKIAKIAKDSIPLYLNTDEGIQRFKTLTTVNSLNPNPVDAETAKKIIAEELTNTGMKRVFNVSESKSSTSITSAGSFGQNTTPPLEADREVDLPIDKSQVNPTVKSLTEALEFKERGGVTAKTFNDPFSGGIPGGSNISSFGKSAVTKDIAVLTPAQKKAADNIAVVLGIKGNNGKYAVKDIEKIRQYAIQQQTTATSPKYKAFTDEEIGKQNNFAANGNLQSAGFYDMETGKFVEFNKLPKSVKNALVEKDMSKISFSGIISADNPFYNLAKENGRENGKTLDGWLRPKFVTIDGKRFVVTSDASERNKADIGLTRAVNQITAAGRTGVPVRMKGPDGTEIVTHPNGKYAQDGQPMYDVKDMNGKLLIEDSLNNLALRVLKGLEIE